MPASPRARSRNGMLLTSDFSVLGGGGKRKLHSAFRQGAGGLSHPIGGCVGACRRWRCSPSAADDGAGIANSSELDRNWSRHGCRTVPDAKHQSSGTQPQRRQHATAIRSGVCFVSPSLAPVVSGCDREEPRRDARPGPASAHASCMQRHRISIPMRCRIPPHAERHLDFRPKMPNNHTPRFPLIGIPERTGSNACPVRTSLRSLRATT